MPLLLKKSSYRLVIADEQADGFSYDVVQVNGIMGHMNWIAACEQGSKRGAQCKLNFPIR